VSKRYLGISIAFSVFLHIVLFGALLYAGGLGKRKVFYSPSFSVSLYESLPSPKRSTQKKKSTITKKAKSTLIKKRITKESKKAWKVKKKSASLKPKKKKTSLSEKKREKEVIEKALAKISKELEEQKLKGATFGRETISLRYKWYYDQIWYKVKANWILPKEVIAEKTSLETWIVIKIGRSGELIEMSIEKSSKNRLYDESCLRAIKKSAPFPPLPVNYPQSIMELGIRFRPEEG